MKDLMLSPCGDIRIENGDLVLVSDADQIRQSWLIRARTFQGEWILNIAMGLPYYQTIFEKGTTRRDVEKIFSDMTLATPGVIRVISVVVEVVDEANREFGVTVEALIEGPEHMTFRFDMTVPCAPEGSDMVPTFFDDLRVWLDVSDDEHLEYLAPVTTLVNRVRTGQAVSVNDPLLVGVAPLGNRRALLLSHASAHALALTDTPAIRGTAGAAFFIVVRQNALTLAPGDTSFGLLRLSGTDGSFYEISVVLNGSSGDSTLLLNTDGVLNGWENPGDRWTSKVYQIMIGADGAVRAWSGHYELTLTGGASGFAEQPALDGDGGVAELLNGYFGELVVYANELSDNESAAVRQYLIDKWLVTTPTVADGWGHFPWGHAPWGHGA